MRIYQTIEQMLNETARDLLEMGVIRRTTTMQDKNISNDENFTTKELTNFSVCITDTKKYTKLEAENLFESFSIAEDAHILMEWCIDEFAERVSSSLINPGRAFGIRVEVWNEFRTKHKGRFAYTYNERIRTQLPTIVDALTIDPWSRQCVMMIWNPVIDVNRIGEDRVPCSLHYHFMCTPDEHGEPELNVIYAMRSCDFVTHMLCDVYLALLMLNYVCVNLPGIKGIKLGKLFINISSLHYYKKDEGPLKKFMEII